MYPSERTCILSKSFLWQHQASVNRNQKSYEYVLDEQQTVLRLYKTLFERPLKISSIRIRAANFGEIFFGLCGI